MRLSLTISGGTFYQIQTDIYIYICLDLIRVNCSKGAARVHLLVNIASTMTSSSDKLSPKFTSSSFYVSFPFYWPAPNVWFFIVQLVEHCSYIAEAMSILIPLSPQNNFRLICNSLNCNYHSDDHVFI